MENTVNINLDLYNELRDFKEEVGKGNVPVLYTSSFNGWTKTEYYTQDEVIKDFTEKNKFHLDKIEALRNEISKQIHDISDIKKMNYFQFKKWKRNNK